MDWQNQRRSENVEDRRGAGGGFGRGFSFPGLGGGRGRGGAMGLGGLLVIVVIALLFGVNPLHLLTGGGAAHAVEPEPVRPAVSSPAEEQQVEFVKVVLATTEDAWHELMQKLGTRYVEPRLVLFRDGVRSACGFAETAVGPFYCPADARVYLDLAFFDDLRRELGAGGDLAQAYVIAHEVGHHVQNLLGTTEKVHALRGRVGEREYNQASVRLELQADYFAGVWAHHAQKRGLLQPGDVDEALRAAAAVGDDRLQRRARGHVVPESFTHGTSEQRARWFRLGFESGDPTRHDPFKAERL
jgi:predicted metalloprotease